MARLNPKKVDFDEEIANVFKEELRSRQWKSKRGRLKDLLTLTSGWLVLISLIACAVTTIWLVINGNWVAVGSGVPTVALTVLLRHIIKTP